MNRDEIKQLVEKRLATVQHFTETQITTNDFKPTWLYISDVAYVDIYTLDNPEKMASDFEHLVLPDGGVKRSCGAWFFAILPNQRPADTRAVVKIADALSGEE